MARCTGSWAEYANRCVIFYLEDRSTLSERPLLRRILKTQQLRGQGLRHATQCIAAHAVLLHLVKLLRHCIFPRRIRRVAAVGGQDRAVRRVGGIVIHQGGAKKRRLFTRCTGRQHGAKQSNDKKHRKQVSGKA